MLVDAINDPAAIIRGPSLVNHDGLIVPYWRGAMFSGGSGRITDVFIRRVETYGRPGKSGPAEGAFLSASVPAKDILGRIRESSYSDIDAVEWNGTEQTTDSTDVEGLCPCR